MEILKENLEKGPELTHSYVWVIVVGIVVLDLIVFFIWRKRRK